MVVPPPCVSGIKREGEGGTQNLISFLSHLLEAWSVSYCAAAGIARYTHTNKKNNVKKYRSLKCLEKNKECAQFDNINLDLKLRGGNFLDNYSTVKLDNTLDYLPITGITGAVV